MEFGSLGRANIEEEEIGQLYETGNIPYTQLVNNQYFILETPSGATTLARYSGNAFHRINRNLEFSKVSPRDAAQKAFVDSLTHPEILLSIALGAAGTGKTSLAMAWALEQINHGKRLILVKPATFIGSAKAFGPVPGSAQEKYAPFLASYQIVLRKILGDKSDGYVELLLNKKQIEFMPIEYARGCTFEDCTLIIDEAQNLTWHEFSSIVSRVGQNSKAIILGDLSQIDVKLKEEETGLYRFCESRAQTRSGLTSVIHLTHQYRSALTQLICDVDGEIRSTK